MAAEPPSVAPLRATSPELVALEASSLELVLLAPWSLKPAMLDASSRELVAAVVVVVEPPSSPLGVVPPRGPQSTQSVPNSQTLKSEPGPPSSQSPSAAKLHVFAHSVVVVVAAVVTAPPSMKLLLLLLLEPSPLAPPVLAPSSLVLVVES